MDLLVIILAVPIGLLAGGFATMLVDRIPDATPLTLRSRCPFCTHDLAVRDTVPVLGWVARRGRCRHCDERITPAYPWVELVTMGLWVAVAARFGWDWRLLPPLILVTALVALSTIDMYVYRLPDRLVFPSLGLSLIAVVVAGFGIDHPPSIVRALAGMALYGGFLLILHLISPRGMGFGDVKLALLLGLHLGWAAGSFWTDWVVVFQLIFYGLLVSCGVGAVGGLLLAVVRRAMRRDVVPDPLATEGQPTRLLSQSMPFGPALAVGTIVVVLFAESFVSTV
ncbi:MAG: prepilin peptidase [Acidimicrobiales bacterium]|nr:prepilin peptidase [Acidimicrobiales bacterium]